MFHCRAGGRTKNSEGTLIINCAYGPPPFPPVPFPISATFQVTAATTLQLLRSEITKIRSSSGNLLKAPLIVSKLFFFGDGITKTSVQCLLLKPYLMCLHELKLQLYKRKPEKDNGKMLLFIILIVNKQRHYENLKRTREKSYLLF